MVAPCEICGRTSNIQHEHRLDWNADSTALPGPGTTGRIENEKASVATPVVGTRGYYAFQSVTSGVAGCDVGSFGQMVGCADA